MPSLHTKLLECTICINISTYLPLCEVGQLGLLFSSPKHQMHGHKWYTYQLCFYYLVYTTLLYSIITCLICTSKISCMYICLSFHKIYPFTKYEYDAQTKFLTCFAAFMDHCHVNEEQNGDQNDGKYWGHQSWDNQSITRVSPTRVTQIWEEKHSCNNFCTVWNLNVWFYIGSLLWQWNNYHWYFT